MIIVVFNTTQNLTLPEINTHNIDLLVAGVVVVAVAGRGLVAMQCVVDEGVEEGRRELVLLQERRHVRGHSCISGCGSLLRLKPRALGHPMALEGQIEEVVEATEIIPSPRSGAAGLRATAARRLPLPVRHRWAEEGAGEWGGRGDRRWWKESSEVGCGERWDRGPWCEACLWRRWERAGRERVRSVDARVTGGAFWALGRPWAA